jgi:hypothetical protein
MIFGLFFLFGHYGDVPFSTLDDPLLIAFLLICCVGIPILGNLRPDKISFLPSMRYYAGNWAASQWLFSKESGAEAKLDEKIYKPARIVVEQLTKVYDRETAELLLGKGLAFRSMHLHGRAINGLLPRAIDDVEAYNVREGELVSGVVNGWNFGDGHLHNEQFIEALQERCGFAPGDVRIVLLHAQPIQRQTQQYRLVDPATGELERGEVRVADMISRQPWDWDLPLTVHHQRATTSGTA